MVRRPDAVAVPPHLTVTKSCVGLLKESHIIRLASLELLEERHSLIPGNEEELLS